MSEEIIIIPLPDTRITKQIGNEVLYPIMYESLLANPFLTTSLRKGIIDKWQEILPSVSRHNLHIYLSRMETAYWENYQIINREGLRNKIIQEGEYMKELLINNTSEPATKNLRVINEINKTSASVGQLSELAPSIEIKINTSTDENSLTIKMNQPQDTIDADKQAVDGKEVAN
jgi:hypothetical protein